MVGVGIVGSGYMAGTYSEAVKTYVKEGRLIAVTGGSRVPALDPAFPTGLRISQWTL